MLQRGSEVFLVGGARRRVEGVGAARHVVPEGAAREQRGLRLRGRRRCSWEEVARGLVLAVAVVGTRVRQRVA